MVKNKISTTICFKIGILLLIMFPYSLNAQQTEEQTRELRASSKYLSEAQQSLQKEKFAEAEADYRKAIALNPKSEVAKYNLGTAYYGKEKNAEALLRFKQAATTATTKAEKHRAFHNLGNTLMNEKNYQAAVAAYKDALRNNPNDDQTRYNLALAKDMLEKNPPPPDDQNDQDNQNQDQDNQDQENQDQNNEDENDGDSGDTNEDESKGDEDKQEADKDEGEQGEPKEEEGDKPQQQQQVPGQLSPQQVKSLLEAMNNEEKKVQEKINAEKEKGAKVKSDKDW